MDSELDRGNASCEIPSRRKDVLKITPEPTMLAKFFYRELKVNDYTPLQIAELTNEVLILLIEDLKR